MNFDFLAWLDWENPVSMWWIFLSTISALNIFFWIWTRQYLNRISLAPKEKKLIHTLIWLSAAYVFVCAFRSVMPRADVQRLCLFDTWFSSVFLGRTVATVAEVCFIAQWAFVLRYCAEHTGQQLITRISFILIPLICVAEIFSWYAVVRTHYFGNTIEESLWAVSYSLIFISLALLLNRTHGAFKYAVGFSLLGSFLYVLYMVLVDVPMYFQRWQSDTASSKMLLNFIDGMIDLNTRWVVSHDIVHWKEEIPWMSLYFSVGVWTSIALCYVPRIGTRALKHPPAL